MKTSYLSNAIGLLAIFGSCVWASLVQAKDIENNSPSAKHVRVAIYDHAKDFCKGTKNLKRFLTPENGFVLTVVRPDEIRKGVLHNNYDVLIMPGGSASSQARHLEEEGRDQIRKFVQEGGGYVGICAGAYLCTTNKPYSLGLVNAKVWDLAHWARGTGTVSLEMTSAGCQALKSSDQIVDVNYGQGPMLAPGEDSDLPGYQVLATYKTEVSKKGAPEGTMVGMHAIVRTMYGTGRVIAFSPHPEKPSGPESLMTEGVRWAGRGKTP
ncbi:BPL-N domain-containing protein [Bremerella alba]|uniref:Biotin-protein ligase N-terminal domain-containing protein n=1 Tax=Bremerella alba TaxID=980252 RepID=A0A7V9A5T2_9BACT|nr:BPL-N domain-containing protein [Bremerella alba]MBA2113558.1 hypothetical protein [Bremerella alba]